MVVLSPGLASATEKARVLIEALPYLKSFQGKTVVIKLGGSLMDNLNPTLFEDIALMSRVGIPIVVVHGGGKAINETLAKLGKTPQFKNGLRVTDEETLSIAEMVLTGSVNPGVVQRFQQAGVPSVGLSGKSGNLMLAKKILVNGEDIGSIGDIESVQPEIIATLLGQGFLPVVAPIASDIEGCTLNLDADETAMAIAAELNAEKLIILTNVPGVLENSSDKASVISEISADAIERKIETGAITGGMIPKASSCAKAIERGVKRVHILDGTLDHSLLLEIFTQQGIGTMITPSA